MLFLQCACKNEVSPDTDQIIVAVVTEKWPTAVACAVSSSGVGADIAHQISISLEEQRGGEDTCQR